ncbi:MAG: hypothetical protein IPL61_35975 [Myxococcales bacterium]|nr:hypothetical protein [Myxococcales bacterium]
MRHRLAFLLCLVPALAGLYATALAQKGQPDPGAPSWNDPLAPGVETVKPMAPTWCAGYKPRPWLPASIPYDELQRSGYSEDLLQQIAALACDRPDDAARQQWIAFYRQGWLNIVGTTEREDREAMAARPQLRDAQKVTTAECKPLWGQQGRRAGRAPVQAVPRPGDRLLGGCRPRSATAPMAAPRWAPPATGSTAPPSRPTSWCG